MENAFLVSLSHLTSLRRQMDVIANNLANANTGAFKSEQVLFEELISPVAEAENPANEVSFVLDYGVVRDFGRGEMAHTGNPLDLAIGGEGFFAVEFNDQTAYTRNGNLALNSDGELVTQAGYRVLNSDRRPITLDPSDPMPVISADGTISVEGQPLQKLAVFEFESLQALKKAGSNLFTANEEPTEAKGELINIQQGKLEHSNVEPVLEITRMIEVMRKYQSAKRLTDTNDELTRKVIDQLSQIR